MCHRRCVLPLFSRVCLLLLGSLLVSGFGPGATGAAAKAQNPVEIHPPVPRPTDVFEIRVTYPTTCPFLGIESEIEGRVVEVTVEERCVCLPGLPESRTRSALVGPLAPGRYSARIVLLHTEAGEACGEPMPFATRDFTVDGEGDPGRLAIEPFPPTPDAPVSLTVRTRCPAQTTVDPPELSGEEITVIERFNGAILAPCFEGYQEARRFELGRLTEGNYTLRLFTVETDLLGRGEVPEEPSVEVEFTVTEVPRLTLADGRFEIEVRWREPGGDGGFGQPFELTSDTGYFWFFEPDNVEVVVKVLDACSFDGHFWVFAAGLTHVEVELRVVDTVARMELTYVNPLGEPFQPIQDTGSFATCDVVSP